MSGKTKQLNLRISTSLRTELERISADQGLSMSDFIRKNLSQAVYEKDALNDRLKSIEGKLEDNILNNIRRMLQAAATISSIDTGIPLDECIATTIEAFEDEDITFSDMLQLSKEEMETKYIQIQARIKQKLNLSNMAIAFISLMGSTFSGFTFDQPVFDISPLSVITLKRMRETLQNE